MQRKTEMERRGDRASATEREIESGADGRKAAN